MARLAERYLELCTEVADPVAQLADEQRYARGTISSYHYRARERGLLTSVGRGKLGGSLTDRARQLLGYEQER